MGNKEAGKGRSSVAGRIVGHTSVSLWGMTSDERFRRIFRRIGLAGDDAGAASVVLVRADHVLDESLVRDLADVPGTILTDREGERPIAAHVPAVEADRMAAVLLDGSATPIGMRRVRPGEITSAYNATLRKRAEPLAEELTRESARLVEARMFGGAYKGATDLVTKYVWPRPALAATRWCARTGVTPNAVTAVSGACVIVACVAFWYGWFVTGLLFAWAMCFLDTVDGKLARVTLTSTKFGDVFDHGIDLIHPPFWYYAWGVGLAGPTLDTDTALAVGIIVAGYVVGRLQEGFFVWRFRIEIHIWQRIDTWFRLITARRNPNLLILSVFTPLGLPALGFWLVAVWTLISLAFHFIRIGQATMAARHGRLGSWLADPA